MMKTAISQLVRVALFAALAVAPAALAKPSIQISISQEKEVVTVKAGVRTTTLVKAQSASSGEQLQYTLTYSNKGDEAAQDAVIEDPIPKGTSFIAGSATGENAEVTFSSDGGKTFAPAVKLTYEVKLAGGAVEKRTATPGEYTHIRWTVKSVAAGATGTVSFRVKVL